MLHSTCFTVCGVKTLVISGHDVGWNPVSDEKSLPLPRNEIKCSNPKIVSSLTELHLK